MPVVGGLEGDVVKSDVGSAEREFVVVGIHRVVCLGFFRFLGSVGSSGSSSSWS